jgi:hypothetical protein
LHEMFIHIFIRILRNIVVWVAVAVEAHIVAERNGAYGGSLRRRLGISAVYVTDGIVVDQVVAAGTGNKSH